MQCSACLGAEYWALLVVRLGEEVKDCRCRWYESGVQAAALGALGCSHRQNTSLAVVLDLMADMH